MEMTMQFLILVSFFVSIFMLLKLNRSKSTPVLPPGPRKLPLIGNLHNLVGDLPHRVLHRLALEHGPLMHLQLGQLSTLIVSSADAAREVTKTHDANFASRPMIMAAEIVSYGATGIIFSPYNDSWRRLRKICTSELLTMKRVQSFRSVREQVYSDFARWIASKERSPINLSERFYAATYDVTSMVAFGKKMKGQARLVDAIKELGELAAGFDVADLYPSIKLLREISRLEKRLKQLHQEADAIFEDIIREHKVAAAIGRAEQEDLVDVLLKLQEDELEQPLTTDSIKSVIMDILGAGSESSATTMDWAMVELLKNPQVMEKAQDEVRQVFDKKGFVDESCIHELKYLNLVIKEALRLHIAVPLLLPRICMQACKINGYEIPVDTRVIINAWAMTRDPKYWEDPEEFKPERFLDSSVDYKGNHFEYIPFGAGRRMCPGISFALSNIELPLAMFLYHFDWNLPAGMKHEEMDMTERLGVTSRRVQGLCVVPVIRRPLPAVE